MKNDFSTSGAYLNHLLDPTKRVISQLGDGALLKTIVAGAMATCHAFFTDHLEGAMVLITMVVFDQIAGVACAIRNHEFSSSKFRHGIVKLFMYLVLVAAFHVLGTVIGMREIASLDKFAILYLTITEALSIVENVQCSTGVKLPRWIADALKSVGKRKP